MGCHKIETHRRGVSNFSKKELFDIKLVWNHLAGVRFRRATQAKSMLVRMGRMHTCNGMKRIGRGEDIVCREGRYGYHCRYFVLPRPIAATHVALIENIKIAL